MSHYNESSRYGPDWLNTRFFTVFWGNTKNFFPTVNHNWHSNEILILFVTIDTTKIRCKLCHITAEVSKNTVFLYFFLTSSFKTAFLFIPQQAKEINKQDLCPHA